EGQDVTYDSAARVRTHLAAGDAQQALADAKSVAPAMADPGSPAHAVAEGAALDPAWLRTFMEGVPANGTAETNPRTAAAFGWLSPYEGRGEEALRHRGRGEATVREGGWRLVAWHV